MLCKKMDVWHTGPSYLQEFDDANDKLEQSEISRKIVIYYADLNAAPA